MRIEIDNRQSEIVVSDDLLRIIEGVIKETLLLEGFSEEVEVSVSLVNDEEIRELNRIYRGVNLPTDVLSFPMQEGDDNIEIMGMPVMLGDIVISLERAFCQSEEYGHSFERETGYLTAHGMLHLLGYDHIDDKEKEIMRAKEEKILDKYGLRR
ncbi:rRNA maturation RNase YbeY [Calorimonas adulescens]|uniref:Endoribonuclease YbeY n=1 Tax=Calorimonas adulescens TaxID=2606906 RepID=A0A5D8QAS0_9THEO|nr:rRNA maturation RNase YbeY [Calorimonas adulescens]TZE81855.1 rRNA maturation RNase YbeY [Calorimonas adulescens]